MTAATVPQPTAGLPWPEPWQARRDARPRTEYWDVETACWQCSAARVPRPRLSDASAAG